MLGQCWTCVSRWRVANSANHYPWRLVDIWDANVHWHRTSLNDTELISNVYGSDVFPKAWYVNCRQTDRQTGGQTDTQTHRQTDNQTLTSRDHTYIALLVDETKNCMCDIHVLRRSTCAYIGKTTLLYLSNTCTFLCWFDFKLSILKITDVKQTLVSGNCRG